MTVESYHSPSLGWVLLQVAFEEEAEPFAHVAGVDVVIRDVYPGAVELVGGEGDVEKFKQGGGAEVVEPEVLASDNQEELGLVQRAPR